MAEEFDLVDEQGRVVGSATRNECHGNPELMHPVVHVLVFDRAGRLYLQKRSMAKDIQPGRWDTSVGGHLARGEAPDRGAARELAEELGVSGVDLHFAYRYVWRSPVETELVTAFGARWDGPFRIQAEEIDDGRFWAFDEIEAARGRGLFTPQFESEFPRMREYWTRRTAT